MKLNRSNIFKHSYLDLISNSAEIALAYGDIAINFTDKGLYTKLQSGNTSRIGNSVRKLTDLAEYVEGTASSSLTYSLLKLLYTQGILTITTTYPFISINELKGTDIDIDLLNDTNINNNYLSFNSDLELVNTPKRAYGLSDLSDVVTNIGKVESNDNFVLTTTLGESTPGKDPFQTTYYYRWSLKPEASQIKLLDDVNYGNPQSYDVFRVYRTDEDMSYVITNSVLSISWDINPTLAYNLNCNNNAILHQNYSVQSLTLTNTVETIDCNFDIYNFYYLNCTDVYVLNINIQYTPNFISQGLKCNGLIIENFTGAIQFNDLVEYENGLAPIYTGSTNIFNILTYQDRSGIITRVLYKSLNLIGFN